MLRTTNRYVLLSYHEHTCFFLKSRIQLCPPTKLYKNTYTTKQQKTKTNVGSFKIKYVYGKYTNYCLGLSADPTFVCVLMSVFKTTDTNG